MPSAGRHKPSRFRTRHLRQCSAVQVPSSHWWRKTISPLLRRMSRLCSAVHFQVMPVWSSLTWTATPNGMQLSSNDGPIFAPVEMESNDPNEVPMRRICFCFVEPESTATSVHRLKQNDREAYVFDISGRSQHQPVMSASEAAANWVGFAQVVPEPGSLTLVMFGLAAFGIRRRRS